MPLQLLDPGPAWRGDYTPVRDQWAESDTFADRLVNSLGNAEEALRALQAFVYDERLLESLKHQLEELEDEAGRVRKSLKVMSDTLADVKSEAEYLRDALEHGEPV